MSRALVSALVLAASSHAVNAADLSGAAGGAATDGSVVLVELFTSEGCSSCPPADALLGRLAQEPLGGVRVVALSEHVDYWDDLGWRDRFSSPVFTRRQEAYARRLGLSGLYTPQLVVAGRTNVLGSDAHGARAAIAAASRAQPGRIDARVRTDAQGGPFLEVEAAWKPGVKRDVLVALVQDRAMSRVQRGENAGRTLDHFSVVRSLAVLGSGVGAWSGRAPLPRGEIHEAAHVVVFVQDREGGPVEAAASVALP